MRASRFFAAALTLMPVAFGATVRADSRESTFEVIVNQSNPTSAVDREFLADAFLKKATAWPSGETILPVDLGAGSPVRRRFSDDVLHRSVAEVKSYWQQRIFSGHDVPPPELDSNEEVIQYVLKHTGAVGYVAAAVNHDGTKVLTVR